MIVIALIKALFYALFSKKEAPIFPEDYNNRVFTSPRTPTARKMRMSMDFAMQREYVKTQRSEDARKAALSNREECSKKPPKKGSRKMTWAQFVENSRNVADSFTKAYQMRRKKRLEAVENRDSKFINKL